MMKNIFLIVFIGICVLHTHGLAADRNEISIVGSSAVLPFAQKIAENYSAHFGYPSPSMEVTGAGKGFNLFCAGIGYQHPDINVTARPITDAELAACEKNGVDAVVEIIVGMDVLAIAQAVSAPEAELYLVQLFKAMSSVVEKDGNFIANPYRSWSDIDPGLPEQPIRIMGPAPSSSYDDAFAELVMQRGCAMIPNLSRLSGQERFSLCHIPRQDNMFVPGLNSEAAVVRWLVRNPEAFAVVPHLLLDHYPDQVRAVRVEKELPTASAVSSGRYPFARPIYFYVKKRHVEAIAGLQEFVYEFTAERSIGPDGYLADRGFFNLDDQGRNAARDAALSLIPLIR
jgi:phosphate transport system substrate-binding protein